MVETTEHETTNPGRRFPMALVAGAAVVVLLLGLAVGWFFFRPYTYAGLVLQAPTRAPALSGLEFHTGEPADLSQFDGDIVMLYFGYTHCPDVCPLTLSTVARAKEMMGEDGDRVHMVMVTVDPQRDTAEALADYVTYFDPSFLGVLGPDRALREAAVLYNVYVESHEGESESGYVVDHTTTLMAIDPDGYLRLLYSTDVPVEVLAADLTHLLK